MGLITRAMDYIEPSSEEVTTTFHFDESDDRFVIERTQDVERILKKNVERRKLYDGYNKDRDWKMVGDIPLVMIEAIMKEEGWNPLDQNEGERLLQLLDRPEFSKFKTSNGTVAHRPQRNYLRASAARSVKAQLGKGCRS